jgi:hypothetical protein
VVPTGQSWLIDQVRVSGSYEGAPPSIVNVFFYADANGSPGAEVYSRSGITASNGPDYAIPLSGVPLLIPGTYWVSVQQRAELGYWAWTTRTVQTGNLAMSRVLPFMGGLQPWLPRRDRWMGTDPDQIFTLSGTSSPYPPPPSNIITLGKPKLNRKQGTAKLPVTVPGPGTLTLTGEGVVKQTKTPPAAATVKLLVKSKGKKKRTLNRTGRRR